MTGRKPEINQPITGDAIEKNIHPSHFPDPSLLFSFLQEE
jgi:hypothetical protein